MSYPAGEAYSPQTEEEHDDLDATVHPDERASEEVISPGSGHPIPDDLTIQDLVAGVVIHEDEEEENIDPKGHIPEHQHAVTRGVEWFAEGTPPTHSFGRQEP
jgi:hypothetical protein